MPFDALTLAAVRHELEDKLAGGRIQNVIMPGPLTVSLEVYRAGTGRARLILSAHPQHARVHIASSAPSRDPETHPPLLLLLRKHVRGGTLVGVSQPRFERVIILSIAKRLPPDKHQEYHPEGDFMEGDDRDDPSHDEELLSLPIVHTDLVVEIMGRVSNIVMVEEDGTVMDSIKRVPSSINRYRVTLPHHPYVPPPPQEKRDPLRTTINALALELGKAANEDAKSPAWKGLVGGYAAVSPLLAREIAFRALGTTSTPAEEVARRPDLLGPLLNEMQAVFVEAGEGHWPPVVAVRERPGEGEPPKVLDFAAYPLSHLEAEGATVREMASISEAAALYYDSLGTMAGHSALKAQVAAVLADIRSRDERKLQSLREEHRRAQSLEELRRKGEMLYAYMHLLEPGQRILTIPDENVTIELDPALTPAENAQAIFREYRKARSAMEGLPERIAASEIRLAYLDDLATGLYLAANYDEIKAVQAEVKAAGAPLDAAKQEDNVKKGGGTRGGKGKKQQQSKSPQPRRLQTRSGLQMLLGRTAGQNDTATFRLAAPEDLWFHVRNAPGSHVILRSSPAPTPEDIEEAARVAATNSRLRNDTQVDVVYTERRNVRKIPNAPPGQVAYKNERAIRVAPLPPG